MKNIQLPVIPDFDTWRLHARHLLAEKIHPSDVTWNGTADLFAADTNKAPIPKLASEKVPREFIDQAKTAIHHSSPTRYALLYRILWRILHENKNIMFWTTDNDIIALKNMCKAVRRDAYKIKAFVRCREVANGDFVAWYEPEHFSLELSVPFFCTRFANMNWSILTPYRAAHWNDGTLTWSAAPDRASYPTEDKIEDYWKTYYANIFNPARIKKKAMLAQMPKKYWKNMPETDLVGPLLRSAHAKVEAMIERSK